VETPARGGHADAIAAEEQTHFAAFYADLRTHPAAEGEEQGAGRFFELGVEADSGVSDEDAARKLVVINFLVEKVRQDFKERAQAEQGGVAGELKCVGQGDGIAADFGAAVAIFKLPC